MSRRKVSEDLRWFAESIGRLRKGFRKPRKSPGNHGNGFGNPAQRVNDPANGFRRYAKSHRKFAKSFWKVAERVFRLGFLAVSVSGFNSYFW
jgi:hypothetical protein